MHTRRSRCAKPAHCVSVGLMAISLASCGDTHSSASTKYAQCAEAVVAGAHTRVAPKTPATAGPPPRPRPPVREAPCGQLSRSPPPRQAHATEARHRRMSGSSFSVSTTSLTRDAARRRIITGVIWPQAQATTRNTGLDRMARDPERRPPLARPRRRGAASRGHLRYTRTGQHRRFPGSGRCRGR